MRTLEQLQENVKQCLEEQALILAEYEVMKEWMRNHLFIGQDTDGRLFWTDGKKFLANTTELVPLKSPG